MSLGSEDSGHHWGIFLGVLADDLQAPGAYRGACGPTEALVAGKNGRQTLFSDHAEGFAQSKEKIRRRCVGEKASAIVFEDWFPVPIELGQACVFVGGNRF